MDKMMGNNKRTKAWIKLWVTTKGQKLRDNALHVEGMQHGVLNYMRVTLLSMESLNHIALLLVYWGDEQLQFFARL